ncbi:GDP-mannose 4,6-dehydratase [Nocardioides panacisoli]|uniref:GDP-mannose 4,6-dehydratase n=1 Tax=Nocardioides panacisoli TaxID=627624 RepID=UPI001C63B66C|nr:GDP-mannose 4,6-dehydratase [Nocardioides panacisoli]QYJ03924.1 GDP-mannose 4,6-dehydratase [Nocardioides panacisoli]
MKTALVTGASGQDGLYLARRLCADKIAVTGTVTPGGDGARRVATYAPEVEVVPLDLRDAAALRDVVRRTSPDEVYNLAAVSSVGRSWAEPELTHAVNATAVEVLVEALLERRDRSGTEVRLFQASSAEVDEHAAASPYARSKAAAERVVRAARDEHGLHASIGRLHIHESPLRADAFVSRKITRTAAAIACGLADRLTLGNLDVVRDWGFADDYVDAIRRMVALPEPADLPIGTGRPHGLDEFVATAFAAAGLGDPAAYVEQDPALVRPVDTPVLVADPEPAAQVLGWRAPTRFADVVGHMVAVDLARLRSGVADRAEYLHPVSGLRA